MTDLGLSRSLRPPPGRRWSKVRALGCEKPKELVKKLMICGFVVVLVYVRNGNKKKKSCLMGGLD